MLLCALTLCLTSQPAASTTLWQIGQPDGSTAKFALGPKDYSHYSEDPIYVVGLSKTKDWPYVLPGPADGWAKGRTHSGTVYFGLSGVSAETSARLTLDFVETHSSQPPTLVLNVNNRRVTAWNAPRGNGDDALEGSPEKGRHCEWVAEIPKGFLKDGNNQVAVQNAAGSWVVFDAVKFEAPSALQLRPTTPSFEATVLPQQQALYRTPKGAVQKETFEVVNVGPARDVVISLDKGLPTKYHLETGRKSLEYTIPQVKKPYNANFTLRTQQITLTFRCEVAPVRMWDIYLLPHSHVDIGYTDPQAFLLAMHQRNLFDGMAVAKESAGFPRDSRYHLNEEATWPLDRLLQTVTPEQKAQIAGGLKRGDIAESAAYCNLLTGLMRPEELMRDYRFSRTIQDELGVTMDTASQTDVPGATWGDVTALGQAGIKNLVLMPNFGDRIGGVSRAWQDKPFYWVSPSGQEKVLVWETVQYGIGHGIRGFNGDRTKLFRTNEPTRNFIGGYIFDAIDQLAEKNYPYNMVGLPWSMSDNPPVDADVPYAAKAWNEKYVSPHIVVSTLHDACAELVRRYGPKLPVVHGDFTPYWEDGAGSTAAETALNRASADRLVQAETLYALNPSLEFPKEQFLEGWRNVLLYSEHTWGADNSISEPDSERARSQWQVKQSFALKASEIANSLVASGATAQSSTTLSIINTSSWFRSELVTLSAAQSAAGDRVTDGQGKPLPSQRLKSGELAVLVKNIPGMSVQEIKVLAGEPFVESKLEATATSIKSSDIELSLDPERGSITSLVSKRLGKEFVAVGDALNAYAYLIGSKTGNVKSNSAAKFEVVESGPLVAKIRVTSTAPGTKSLVQEIGVVAGINEVSISDVLDKTAVREKEGAHIGFPFQVPDGQIRVDMPWSVVRPELDQIAGSNKNWLCAQRYVDVSNDQFGVSCAILDAPLVEIGGITANLIGSQMNPDAWIQHLAPTQTFYSWILNNHWHTNYKADQEGKLTFRYVIRPHGPYAADEASRFGIGAAQPLVVGNAKVTESLLSLSDPAILVTSLKPSDDGKALIVRLWNSTDKLHTATMTWKKGRIGTLTKSDLAEHALAKVGESVTLPGWGVTTIRAELAK